MQNTGPFLNASQALEREIDNTGVVAQYDALIGERIGFGAALRHDDNDLFDDADTYRVQASYRFDSGTRLRAAAGSGIKNPLDLRAVRLQSEYASSAIPPCNPNARKAGKSASSRHCPMTASS